jgi:D-glycero-D-manno-heptose 1,7-bisphosphate phosphatase
MPRPALFLDRDGVINLDSGYVFRTSDFIWIDGVFETVRVAKQLGLLVIVVTNQAGIARGHFTESDFESLTTWMMRCFQAEQAALDAVYYCPYHADGIGLYRVPDHPDRKPNPGMLLRAARDYGIDLHRSALVGDKSIDIDAAVNAGLTITKLFSSSARIPEASSPDTSYGHAAIQQWLRLVYSVD